MTYINYKNKIQKQLKDLNEKSSKCENLSNIKIRVSKDIYDKAEKMAKRLNTDVEGIFTIAAYRLIDT